MWKKKYIIISSILGGILLGIMIFLICFFNIPRITYSYDYETDTYYVDKVYGNASSYTILDTVDDKPVTRIRDRAFMKKDHLVEVHLGKNITEIERLAFLDCKNLKQISLNYVKRIGRNAFENCTSLEEVELSIDNILGGTFMGCSKLSKVILINTETIGTYAFYGTSIESITIPSTCYLVGVDAFKECNHLSKIIIKSKKLMENAYINSLNGVEFQFDEKISF